MRTTPEATAARGDFFSEQDGFDTAQSLDCLLKLRSRYTSPPEAQGPQNIRIELASGLVFNHWLKKARWDSEKEIKRFIDDINAGLESGRDLFEAVSTATGETINNMVAYYNEITRQRPFLVHTNRFDEYKGQTRLVGNNGRPVVDAITAEERKGAVLQASQQIEANLLTAPKRSFMVLMSSAGANGFVGEQGQRLSHLNTQVMIFWKDKYGFLKGGTLVLDLTLSQAEKVMKSLGVSKPELKDTDELEKLADIVRHPALLCFPRSDMTPFEYVLDKIISQRGNSDFRLRQQDDSVEIRTIAEVRRDIRRFDEILELTEDEEACIAQFRQFALENWQRVGEKEIQQGIITRKEKAILAMTRLYLISKNPDQVRIAQAMVETNAGNVMLYKEDNFEVEIAFLMTRAGCPPGATALALLRGTSLGSSPGGPVSAGFAGEASKKRCISCGEVNYCTKDCYKCGGMLI